MTDFLQEITTEPGDPFFTGTGPVNPLDPIGQVDYSMPVSLGDRGFLIDRSPNLPTSLRHSRQSIDLLSNQAADSAEDTSSAPPEVWRRIVESWHQGSGQSRHDRTVSLPYRFADSYNVDVWDDWRLTLLRDTANIQALTVGKALIETVGPSQFVVVKGTTSYWWTSLASAPTLFTLPQTALDITSDGSSLYTLDSLGQITRYTAPATGSVVSTVPNFDPARAFLSYIKGFLVASGGQYLYDMTSGTATLIYQHPLATFTWIDACEGMSPAYLIGGVGDKWAVYGMTINADATTFDPPVAAASIPEGEIGYALASYLGYILIGTSAGWRFGIPAGDGSLTFGKLVETSSPVQCFEGQDRFVWYGQSGTPAGLGRADLSQFTAPMTPAYANDLRTTSGGEVTGVITFAGRRVFVISGEGVFAEQDNYAITGWVDEGGMSFNSADPKMGMYLQVSHEPMPIGASIVAEMKYDSSGWIEVGRSDAQDSTAMGKASLMSQFYLASTRITLYRSTANPLFAPVLTRTEIRALNVPGQATEFRLPLMLRSTLYVDERTDFRDPADDYDFLTALWADRRPFFYREAGNVYRVHATDFLWLPEQVNENGSAYEGLLILTAKEIR